MIRRYRVVDLGPPQLAVALNDAGLLAGQHVARPESGTRGISLGPGAWQSLDTLGGEFSTARGLNDRGVVVGHSLTTGNESHHGFLFTGSRMYDLNDLIADREWEVILALDVNNRGEIVGVATRHGIDRAVLLVPDAGTVP